MEREFTKEQQYVLACKRVEKMSKFYKHLTTYIVINIFLTAIFIVGDIDDGDTFYEAFSNYHNYKIWVYWGLAIVFQALNVFGIPLFFSKSWKERKIRQYMEEEKRKKNECINN
ncbi:MAG: 2TM domain-containing protein [Polaribacter sp.]